MSNPNARARAGQDRANLYNEITDKIVAELEAGRVPWVQLWGTAVSLESCRVSLRHRVGDRDGIEKVFVHAGPPDTCDHTIPGSEQDAVQEDAKQMSLAVTPAAALGAKRKGREGPAALNEVAD